MEPLRFGRLRRMAQSPAHFKYAPDPESTVIDIGAASHSIVLGGPEVICFHDRRQGKAWEAFEAEHEGAIILNRREMTIAQGMAASVKANPLAMRLLEGEREKTMLWDCDGRPCRGTPDVRGHKFMTELKTGETADPRRFQWKARQFCHHGQLAWYDDGAVRSGLDRPEAHYVIAVEATAPFVSTVFRLSHESIELGRRLIHLWLEQLRACEEADAWPGYCQSVVDLDVTDGEGLIFDEAA